MFQHTDKIAQRQERNCEKGCTGYHLFHFTSYFGGILTALDNKPEQNIQIEFRLPDFEREQKVRKVNKIFRKLSIFTTIKF